MSKPLRSPMATPKTTGRTGNRRCWRSWSPPDGGVPLARKRGDGNAAETQMVQERAAAWRLTLQGAPTPRYRMANSTLSREDNAAQRQHLGFITRMPGPRKRVAPVISPALRGATGPPIDDAPRSQRLALCHSGMAQRGLIVASAAALQRAETRVSKAQKRALATVQKQRFH